MPAVDGKVSSISKIGVSAGSTDELRKLSIGGLTGQTGMVATPASKAERGSITLHNKGMIKINSTQTLSSF